MSLPLLPEYRSEDKRSMVFLSSLTKKERNKLENFLSLMDINIFTPIIEAENKEDMILRKEDEFRFYLNSAIPILLKIVNEIDIIEIYDHIRRKITGGVKDKSTAKILLKFLDVAEEHDRYIIKLSSDYEEITRLVQGIVLGEYLRLIVIVQLIMAVILTSLEKKPSAIKSISIIGEKYADKLETFVANFQVSLETDLEHIRKRTLEEDIEKARIL